MADCEAASSTEEHSPRLLCVDLDGTLYGSDHQVSKRNANAIAAAAAKGYTIALCTGRGPTMYCPTAKELGVPGGLFLVGYNGAVVFWLDEDGHPKRVLFETKMSEGQVNKILKLADGLAVEFDVRDVQYARRFPDSSEELLAKHVRLVRSSPVIASELPEVGPGKCEPNKLSVLTSNPDAFVATANGTPGFSDDGIGVVVGGPFWVETVNLKADKASGVRLLCEEIGCTPSSCVYLGDGANDATSLELCGLGIAMSQAKPEAKAAATRVSRWTNDEDAVAREIEFLLSDS